MGGVWTIALTQYVGWIFIPNMPDKQDAWYLSQEEREHGYKRLGEPRKYTWDRTVFRRVLLSWQFWLLPFIFMCKWWLVLKRSLLTLHFGILSCNPNGTKQRLPTMDGFSRVLGN